MRIASNGLRFEVETAGDDQAPAVLLTMGLGMQLTAWPERLLTALVEAGYRVIRYDNRDIGLSSHLDALGEPNLLWQFVKSRLGLSLRSAYGLQDMAQDALGILDALGVARAHLVGVSMGGMISQRIAATASERVLSLTSVMSSSGAPGLPGPTPEVSRTMVTRPKSPSPQDVVEHTLGIFRLIGSPAYPQDMPVFRQHLLDGVQRSYHREGVARQLLAIMTDRDRHTLLPSIACPTLVIHGAADPLVPMACGKDTATRIPGARFEAIQGMGHDWPPGVATLLANHIVPHLNAATTTKPA
ncbi:alpha/beta fold hydrolase [Hydrogenophaga sp.]|uniref:alpha/beta fold hydrolase n=1 Tax=Hydrogenophaga sp. TaxID=1904254 RepID=UPI003F6C5A51